MFTPRIALRASSLAAAASAGRQALSQARIPRRGYSSQSGAGNGGGSSARYVLGLGAGAAVAFAGYEFVTGNLLNAWADSKAPVALTNGNDFFIFRLREAIPLTHNTSIFRFDLPSKDHTLGLPTASCVIVKTVGDAIMRPYTPTTDVDQKGYFDLVIKKYPGGAMSQHIFGLKPGDAIEVKGPIVKYPYKPNEKREIGMIAGGTGITPMYQVIREIVRNPADKTKVSLVYGNVSEDDIILRKELDGLAKAFPDKLSIHYVLDKASPSWTGGRGYITEEMLRAKLPSPSDPNAVVMVCGPEGMMKHICGPKGKNYTQGELLGLLKNLGFSQERVFKF